MKMVPETIIDQISADIGADEKRFSDALHEFKDKQPVVLGYLFTENFEIFTQAEREYLLFLVVSIYQSIETFTNKNLPTVTPEQIASAEDQNWGLLNDSSAKAFRDRIDLLFDGYPQEDLLAFAEDALAEEEENGSSDAESPTMVTKESREAIFILLKSLIDCFTGLVFDDMPA